jgi:hypothetical protein
MSIRTFGFILIAGALFMGLGDAYSMYRYGESLSLGDVWGSINLASLNLTQVFIQRYVWSPLWSYFIHPILLTPVWLAMTIIGVAFIFLSLKKQDE